ncbi:hypothetical protein P0D88_50875, partial [Paraburkholderia sp. RL18-103-BIB-C]|uniref:hypothetical protein n=1 Tax=unclassified Paraburkholderia TaxID=2615204 RepID=UPI0038B80DB9
LSVPAPQPAKCNVCACQKRESRRRGKKCGSTGFYANCYSESWNLGIHKKSLDAYIFFFFFSETDVTLILFNQKMTGD